MTDTDRLSACEGKESFSHDMASKVSRRMKRSDSRVTPYQCRVCRQWHVGTANKLTKQVCR